MKSRIKALLAVSLFLLSQPSMAQWRFHAEVFPSDECENTLEGKISRGAAKAMCNDDNSKTWKTEQECNEVRKVLLEWNQEAYTYCRIVVKASPCQCSGNTDRVNGNHSSTSRENNSQQAMLAKKRAAKESARRKAEAERIRKERERQRKYNEALQKGYQQTSAAYTTMHKETAYRSGEGYERMMLTVPVGTERIQSSYIPSETVVNSADIDDIIAHRTYSQFEAIRLLPDNYKASNTGGLVYVNWGDYSEMQKKLDDCMREMDSLGKVYKRQEERQKKFWAELTDKLDGGQEAYLKYIITKDGIPYPEIIGVLNGEYYFRTEDSRKLFILSKDGTVLTEYTYDEKNWKALESSLSITFNESGKVELTELDELKPKFMADGQLTMVDNSTSIAINEYIIPRSLAISSGIGLTPVSNSGVKSTWGLDIESETSLRGSYTFSKLLLRGEAKASVLEGKVNLSPQVVVRLGNKYYLSKVDVAGKLGVGAAAEIKGSRTSSSVSLKGEIGWPIYYGSEVNLVVFKDITPSSSLKTGKE